MSLTVSDDSGRPLAQGYGEEPGERADYENANQLPGNQETFIKLKRWVIDDMRHSGDWRREAREHYDMVAGRQWTRSEESHMINQQKQPIKFNRMLSIVKTVAGHEIHNRQEIKYHPRGMEDVNVNETLTGASNWMSDNCDAEDEESDAFEDTLICGMGWCEHLIEYDLDEEGMYSQGRTDPLEMAWDYSAKKKNLVDARRIHRIRRDVDLDEARRMFPGVEDFALDAKWVTAESEDSDPVPIELRREREGGLDSSDANFFTKQVCIVETQWYERQPYHKVALVGGTDAVDMSPEQYNVFSARAGQMGLQYQSVRLERRVYKRAFMGSSGFLGEIQENVAGQNFTYTCITGERDRNQGTWFGLVSVMNDPQKFANKWLTNTLHLLNVNAKGGILAEKGAFEDQRQAENSYAKPQEITWMNDGALSGQNPMVMPKPISPFPQGFFQLMEFAISSIRDTTGVNLELLGLVDRNQPGILEAQRKQAGMVILATLFNNLRRSRKIIGRIRLHYIQNYLSDGRLVRVTGPMGKKAMPLIRDKTIGKYDVIVDEAGTGVNQKQETWAMIVQVLPIVQEMLTPEIMFTLLKYSPLPESLIENLEQIIQNSQQDPQVEEQKKLMMQEIAAKIVKDQASAEKQRASAQRDQAEAQKTLAEIGQIVTNTAIALRESGRMHTISDPNVQKIFQMAADMQDRDRQAAQRDQELSQRDREITQRGKQANSSNGSS